jgi:hypothetical protein
MALANVSMPFHISPGPKKYRFPGPNPLPLALEMDAARIKSIKYEAV